MHIDVLAFGAHPDDIELTCGGTIVKLGAMGYKTGVIALTQGELGTRGTAEIRAQEFEAAGKIMGLSVHKMLDIPDGNVSVTQENKLKVIQEIREYKPRIVFAPYWKVRHPDHGHTSKLVLYSRPSLPSKRVELMVCPANNASVSFCVIGKKIRSLPICDKGSVSTIFFLFFNKI